MEEQVPDDQEVSELGLDALENDVGQEVYVGIAPTSLDRSQ